MKVPEYQEKITTITPETRAPTMPNIRMPGVVPGAFGENVGQAYETLGKVGEKIAGHLQQMAFDEQDKVRLQKETAFMQDWQDRLTNPNDETIQVNGQDVTRKKGLLLRPLGQAEGVTLEAKLAYKKMREQYLDGLSRYQYDKLAPFMDRHFLSIEDKLVTHEQNQRDENFKNITESNITQRTLNASMIRDSKELTFAIDDAIKSTAPYYRKYDEATQKINNEKIAGDIIESSVISTLKNTGNLTQAQSLLDGVKDKLSGDTEYNRIKDTMIKGYDYLKSQTEKIKLESKISDRFDYIGKIADGTLSWEDSDKIIRGIAIKDPQLAEAMTKVVDSKGEYFPEEANNEAYADLVKNVFTAGSKEEISNFLIEALDATANKEMSRDRLTILVSAAQERAKSLPVGANDEPVALSPKQNEIDAGIKAIINIKNKQFSVGDMIVNFFKSITSGKSPQDAHTEAVKSEINRTNSLSIKYKVGDIITNSKGESAEIVGFDDNGSPMLKRKISGKQTSNTK